MKHNNKKKKTFIYKCIVFFALIFLLTLSSAPMVHSENSINDSISKKINIVVHDANPPFTFVKDGTLTGFGIDLIKNICREMNYECNIFSEKTQEKAILDVESGKADVIGLVLCELNNNKIYMSEPYFYVNFIFVVPQNSTIISAKDLIDKKIAVVHGTSAEKYLIESNYTYRLVQVKNNLEALNLVKNGNVDGALITSEETYKYLIEENNISGLKILPERIKYTRYCLGINNNKKYLVSRINTAIINLKIQGTYNELINKWLSEEYLNLEKIKRTFIRFSEAIISILIVALIILAIMYKKLLNAQEKIKKTYKELDEEQSILREFIVLLSNLDPNANIKIFFDNLLSIILKIISAIEGGFVIIFDNESNKAIVISSKGIRHEVDDISIPSDILVKKKEISLLKDVFINDYKESEDKNIQKLKQVVDEIHSEGCDIVYLPFYYGKDLNGALYFFILNKKNKILTIENLQVLNTIQNLISSFISMKNVKAEKEAILQDIILTIIKATELKDPYTSEHSQRVAEISYKFAKFLGFDEEHASEVYWAGILHDIGKIGVPDVILLKEDELNKEERSIIEQHPIKTYLMLIDNKHLRKLAFWCKHHHERWDGMGYPDKLKGEEIPMESAILALADAFDAMSTVRPYKDKMNLKEIIQEIKRESGKQFHPELSWKFIEFLLEEHKEDKSIKT